MHLVRADYFPVVFAFSWADVNEADVRLMHREYPALHRRGQRFIIVTDSRGSELPNAHIRKALADLVRTTAEASKQNLIANSVVVSNRVTAGVLTAMKWLVGDMLWAEPVWSMRQGLELCAGVAAKEGLGVPDKAWALVQSIDDAQSNPELLNRLRTGPW